MYNTKRIITLDIEGDGLKKEINQKLFPTGCHFDPNTRIWCATITTRVEGVIRTYTYTTKLNGTRPIFDYNGRMVGMTTAEHYESTVIPTEIDTVFGHHKIIPCDSIYRFMQQLLVTLHKLCGNGNYDVWIKGYNSYKYDQIAILSTLYRLCSTKDEKEVNEVFESFNIKFRDAAAEFPKLQVNWPGTTDQVQIGDFKENQIYMNVGIKHNIEDSYQLFTMVERYANEANKLEVIQEDF